MKIIQIFNFLFIHTYVSTKTTKHFDSPVSLFFCLEIYESYKDENQFMIYNTLDFYKLSAKLLIIIFHNYSMTMYVKQIIFSMKMIYSL